MIKDERIITTRNRCLAQGFIIWYCLLLIAILYRQFVLDQNPKDYWDISIIFFLGVAYVSKNLLSHGAYFGYTKISIISMSLSIIIVISLLSYFRGNINSFFDLLLTVSGAMLGLLLLIPLMLYLNYRWKKKNELIDQ